MIPVRQVFKLMFLLVENDNQSASLQQLLQQVQGRQQQVRVHIEISLLPDNNVIFFAAYIHSHIIWYNLYHSHLSKTNTFIFFK